MLSPVQRVRRSIRTKMAPPVYTPEVGQGQDTSHGPQGRKGSRVRRHPHLALCQGSLGILISSL